MKEFLIKVGSFLHILDDDNRLNLTDIAFIIILVKIMFAATLDWPSILTFATVMANKLHKRQVNIQPEEVTQLSQQIGQLVTKIKDLGAK